MTCEIAYCVAGKLCTVLHFVFLGDTVGAQSKCPLHLVQRLRRAGGARGATLKPNRTTLDLRVMKIPYKKRPGDERVSVEVPDCFSRSPTDGDEPGVYY